MIDTGGELRLCRTCRRKLPLAAYGVDSQSMCRSCLSLATKAVMAVKKAKRSRADKDVLADCSVKRLAEILPDVKWCPKCQTNHPRSAFWADASRADGLESQCKACRRPAAIQRSRDRQASDPGYFRANALTYKRVRQRGIPVDRAIKEFGVSFAGIVAGIKSGVYVSRCVRGTRLVCRAEELES